MVISMRLRNAVKVFCELNEDKGNWTEALLARKAALRIGENSMFNATLLELAAFALHVDRDWFELELEKQGFGHFVSSIYLAMGTGPTNPITAQLREAIVVMGMPAPDMEPDQCPQAECFANTLYRSTYDDEFGQLMSRDKLRSVIAALNADDVSDTQAAPDHAPMYARTTSGAALEAQA